MKKGLVYKIRRHICQEAGEKTQYIGETSRNSFDRGREHLLALKKMNKESPLAEDHLECHPNKEPNFKVEVEGHHRPPLY